MRKWILATLLLSPIAFAHGHEKEGFFKQTNLVSNVPGRAAVTDGNLVNAWGLDASGTGPWWVADNGSGLSTLYTGAGAILPLVVHVDDAPTGLVFNPD